jgi:hypothetical protein
MSRKKKIERRRNWLYWILALFVLSGEAIQTGSTLAEESKEIKLNGKKIGTLDPETFVFNSIRPRAPSPLRLGISDCSETIWSG